MSQSSYPPPPPFPSSPQPDGFVAEPPKTGMATSALVLGLLAIPTTLICVGPVLGLLAVILGLLAVVRISGAPETYAGKGRALAGIVTGGASIVLAVLLVSVAFQFFGTVIVPTANIEMVAQSLNAYRYSNGDYPPDLATLTAGGQVPASPFSKNGDPTEGVYYIPGVKPSDPPYWVLAYAEGRLRGHAMYFVVHADGHTEAYDDEEFRSAMNRFQQEFTTRHGRPPTIQEPPEAPPETPPDGEG